MLNLLQLVILAAFISLLASRLRHPALRLGFLFVACLVLILQISAVFLNNTLVNYQFYTHLNFNVIMGHGFQFVWHLVLGMGVFIGLIFSLNLAARRMADQPILRRNGVFAIALPVLLLGLTLPNGILSSAYNISQIVYAEKKGFDEALQDAGIPPAQYVMPEAVTASAGKNIVVISLESIERGFLQPPFNDVTPTLSALATNWSYFDMPVGPGGGWTAGALYKQQVGMPAFFQGQGNDFFQGVSGVKLTGLGHVLSAAGYQSKYLIGNPEFAGIDDILSAYGIEVVSEKNSLGNYPYSPVGLHDYDLFTEAKQQIGRLKQNGAPFALFMSTVNTHFPSGIMDERLTEFVPVRDNQLEFLISAVDYLIADLIDYLKAEGLYDNTAIFIFPDHQLMGSTGPILRKLGATPRGLYLLSNVSKNTLAVGDRNTLAKIDLPRIILDGAGINSNAKFLTDFIDVETNPDFLEENTVALTALNTASVYKRNFREGIKISVTDNILAISSLEDVIRIPLDSSQTTLTYELKFDGAMVVLSHAETGRKTIFSGKKNDSGFTRLYLTIYARKGAVERAYLGNKTRTGIYRQGQNILFSADEIALILESNEAIGQQTAGTTQENIADGAVNIDITSSAFISSHKTPSRIKIETEEQRLRRGFNVLAMDINGRFFIHTFDTLNRPQKAQQFVLYMEALIKKGEFWAIALHDAASTNYPGMSDRLRQLGFKLLPGIEGRYAYIAYNNRSGKIIEHKATTSHNVSLPIYIQKRALDNTDSTDTTTVRSQTYAQDTTRFIAHAGGGIDGETYTNSLQALNHNYQNGFRFFELDIATTADGQYVAAHDWPHWAKISGYPGSLPPSHQNFMATEIYNKYSPLDMTAINSWFAAHPDTTLVTDKINEPTAFASQFVDPQRLMMELFSWPAVEQALASGIGTAMPTISLLGELKSDPVSRLQDLGITHLAASRRLADSRPKLLSRLADAGIKIYAYHVNFDAGKDETYVVCQEQRYFYGLYADSWNFDQPADCEP
ncbi:MAG: sulfatase-like hydrolase/transferase [Pseudomonadales bacterium]